MESTVCGDGRRQDAAITQCNGGNGFLLYFRSRLWNGRRRQRLPPLLPFSSLARRAVATASSSTSVLDTDVMWLRNPFTRLSKNESEDLQISTDVYLDDPWSEKNLINTGFYYVQSNNKTVSLFETWYNKRHNSTGQKEQDVLLSLIGHGIFGRLGLRVRFLDTLYFSGFCQDSKDLKVVTTVHANCCRSIAAKLVDLKAVLRDWKRYKKIASYKRLENTNLTTNFQWTKHSRCWNSGKFKLV
ncbi:Nucleotide-diphospho-sugar transferase [Senna tora]|uniref:Nucleotide-diphospho-sugar transferase n=1 Tax=Senna tora TaxID=362788 RepID=A0A834WKC8_9FABA|nr:Nucleotide-diphospho-sugar transferase [Senna tora]